MQKNRLEILLQFSSPISNVIRKLTALRVSYIKVSWQYQCMKTRNSIWTGSFIELSVLFKTKQLRKYCCINISKWRQYFCILGRVAWDTDHKLGRLYVFFCTFASDTLKEIKAEESDVYSATKRTEATQTTFWDKLVQGHVSEKSFSWAFHEHWSFFAETYSLNGAESKKSCLQFFQSHLGLFYAN